MNENWTIVEVLRHARHDWMNNLQLIKGNLALGKIDQVERVIDDIILEAKQESRLCNLKLPQFAKMLLLFNWEAHTFYLEYEILDDFHPENVDDISLYHWTAAFFQQLENNVLPKFDNHLFLSIAHHEKGVRFFFEFEGKLKETDSLKAWLNKTEEQLAKSILIKSWKDTEFAIDVII